MSADDDLSPALHRALSGQPTEADLAALLSAVREGRAVTSQGARAVAAGGNVSNSTIWTGDQLLVIITAPLLTAGLSRLATDYSSRVRRFLDEYVGTPDEPVPFGGRDEELASLDAWLDDPEAPPYKLAAAPAGRGKSALLVHWSRRLLPRKREDVAIAFFPVSVRYRTNLAGVVFPALAARLAKLYGEDPPTDPNIAIETWREWVAGYLNRPLPDGRRLLLILDGIDEAADWEISRDLFPYAPRHGLKVLVSTRYLVGDADSQSWLRRLGWLRRGIASSLELQALSVEAVRDVLVRMNAPQDAATQVDIAGQIHRLSEGDPLLVGLYVADLAADGASQSRLHPNALPSIKSGLKGYFESWWEDQLTLWGPRAPLHERTVAEVFNLLACALGPLNRKDLLQLMSPSLRITTVVLEEVMRPLKRLVVGDGREQGYVFSHPRLTVYFYEEHMEQAERQAFEERFLRWGQETLTSLQKLELSPQTTSPYLIQYYGAHLERVGASPELLLSLVCAPWRDAWMALEQTYAGFLNDVNRAWQVVEKANARPLASGQHAPYIADEVRCALCHASVGSLVGNLPAEMIAALVSNGIWTPTQALIYVQQSPYEYPRAYRMIELIPLLPEPLLFQALAIAHSIKHPIPRVLLLLALAPRMPQDWRTEIIRDILASDFKSGDLWDRFAVASALKDLLPSMQPEDREPTMAWIQSVVAERDKEREEWNASRASMAIYSTAPELDWNSVVKTSLDLVRAIPDEEGRANALSTLLRAWPEAARRLHEQTAQDLAQLVHELDVSESSIAPVDTPDPSLALLDDPFPSRSDDALSMSIARIAPYLPKSLFAQVLGILDRISSNTNRLRVLARLVPSLDRPLLLRAMDLLLEKTYSWSGPDLEESLRLLGPHLDEPLMRRALDAIRLDTGRGWWALSGIASFLPPHLLREALDFAALIGDVQEQVQTIGGLLQHLPSAPESVVEGALDLLGGREMDAGRASAFGDIAPYFSTEMMGRNVQLAESLKDEKAKLIALASLIPHMDPTLRLDKLQALLEAAESPELFLPLMRFLGDSKYLLIAALRIVRNHYNPREQGEVLKAMAPWLVGASDSEVLEEATNIAKTISGSKYSLQAQIALAAHLTESDRTKALHLLLAKSLRVPRTEDGSGAEPVLELLPYLKPPLRAAVTKSVFDGISTIKYDFYKVTVLSGLSPHLNDQLMRQALELTWTMERDQHGIETQAEALAAMSPFMSPDLVRQALSTANSNENLAYRALLISALAARLSPDDLEEAFYMVREHTSSRHTSRALYNLAPYIPERILPEAVEYANLQSYDTNIEQTLPIMAARLARLSPATQYPVWNSCLRTRARQTRQEVLSHIRTFAPVLLSLGGPKALEQTAIHVLEVGRWWP
ncbi:MAG TPA: hypothetical protein VF914_19980 [Chloroflexia bacterium]|jgi:hypothetical protein